MFQKTRYAIVAFTIVLLFSTCKKDEGTNATPTTVQTYHGKINSNLYPYLFNTASYWIYKNTINNNLDSTVVKTISKNTYYLAPSGHGSNPGDEEYFKIDYLSFPSQTVYSDHIIKTMISRALNSNAVTYISTNTVGNTIDNAKIEAILDTLSVEGKKYHHVTKMRIQATSYITQNYNFYYVDSIGIIKKETRNGDTIIDTWNLIRYQANLLHY